MVNNQESNLQLLALRDLESSLNDSQRQNASQIESFYKNISDLFINVNISDLEDLITNFIHQELVKSGLLNQIESVMLKVDAKLEEIRFFSHSGAVITGFLSSGFSSADNLA